MLFCFDIDYGQKNIFFSNKTFFVFQDRKLKLSESVWKWISLNLTKFPLIQLIQTIVIFIILYRMSDWGFTIFFFKQMLKVSAEKQKSFIPKKIFLSISKQKSFVYWPNFQWRFCCFYCCSSRLLKNKKLFS